MLYSLNIRQRIKKWRWNEELQIDLSGPDIYAMTGTSWVVSTESYRTIWLIPYTSYHIRWGPTFNIHSSDLVTPAQWDKVVPTFMGYQRMERKLCRSLNLHVTDRLTIAQHKMRLDIDKRWSFPALKRKEAIWSGKIQHSWIMLGFSMARELSTEGAHLVFGFSPVRLILLLCAL